MKSKRITLFLAITALITASCTKVETTPYEPGKYLGGAFIINEGGFGSSNGSVSHYSQGSVENDVFYNVNNRPLGDVVNSLSVYNQKAYIVVNNSNKVEIADHDDFTSLGVITGVTQPRYFIAGSETKGYISQWGNGSSVMVADLSSNTIIDSIATGKGPENMLISGSKLYIANSGGYEADSTITVVDISTDNVTETIVVGDNPIEMVEDANGDIWVLCVGRGFWDPAGESPSMLVRFDPQTPSNRTTITLFADQHPMSLKINKTGDKVYFGGGYGFDGIYEVPIASTTAPSTPLISGYFTGFNVDSKNNTLYTLSAPSYTENGTLTRYLSDGSEVDTYTVGIGPRGVVFN